MKVDFQYFVPLYATKHASDRLTPTDSCPVAGHFVFLLCVNARKRLAKSWTLNVLFLFVFAGPALHRLRIVMC
jgi:hypothetical protein